MTSRTLRPAVVAGALALLLTACSPDSPTPSVSPSTTASQPSASASPTPTSTLTPAAQEAFEQATSVALAFRQTGVDLYTGSRTDVNDLNDVVAAGDLLDRELKNASQGLSQGYRSEPAGAQLVLISADPVSIDLDADPPRVVVRACIDATGVTDVAPDGKRTPGVREQLDYTVVSTDYLPAPGWAVLKVTGERDPKDRTC